MSRSRRLLVLGSAAALVGGAAAYRRFNSSSGGGSTDTAVRDNWGSAPITVRTPDGAQLAVWDKGDGPTVVLPHCWGCSHEVWLPVANRLVASDHRVILYDQRGHGASGRGTAELSIPTLAHDLQAVLEDRDVHDAVLAGHSMGGMTIMSLATHRPDVLHERAKAIVLVATAAADMGMGSAQAEKVAAAVIGSPAVSRALRSSQGHRFVRGVFGVSPNPSDMELTRALFADCEPSVRAGFLTAMANMNLLEGIAAIGVPTTVVVGAKDRLTAPIRADQMVSTIPGARLVTLPGRGHMLPLEDADAVTDEIVRAVKG